MGNNGRNGRHPRTAARRNNNGASGSSTNRRNPTLSAVQRSQVGTLEGGVTAAIGMRGLPYYDFRRPENFFNRKKFHLFKKFGICVFCNKYSRIPEESHVVRNCEELKTEPETYEYLKNLKENLFLFKPANNDKSGKRQHLQGSLKGKARNQE